MNTTKAEKEVLQNLILYCAQKRANGSSESEIKQELIGKGLDNEVADKLLKVSQQVQDEKPSKAGAGLSLVGGLVVAGIGIGITAGSDGAVIAYGAIVIGIIWFFKGLIGLLA